MQDVEASGKTIEEAIENALAELDAEREEVEIEVLNEGRPGVLGVGGAPARVRAWLREEGEPGDDDDVGDDEGGAVAVEASAQGEAEDEEEGEYEEDDAERVAQVLDKLLELMGIEADVSIRDPETPGDGIGMAQAVFDVEGDDLGLLIGRRGETLGALQYLLNLMASRQLGEAVFFTVDVEGYRRRREKTLNMLARRMADQVKRTRRPATLEPMPPNERRIVHLALAEDRAVTTESIGEGETRKVEISLKAPNQR